MDFMDKTNAFLEKLEESGISISNQDGETAVICEDCVVVISKSGDKVAVDFVNQIERLDYRVGFTEKDVEDFMILEELMGGADNV
nr:MAG: hypothetical protein [Bacteriophage sp.]